MNDRVKSRVAELLEDFKVTFETPVAWGEMDAFNHVNNIVYFRYFESARIAYFRAVGFDVVMKSSRVGPILASTSCRYRRALSYPDRVTVGARAEVDSLADDRFQMTYRVVSHHQLAVAADGDGLIVSYDYERNAKAPLPDAVRDAILNLDGAK